ncbi:ABC transporter ATP-binding protein/permease, partial [Myxococcota bacterium]|nr:ABC transporter ATP-binding protein/permease [Myxococcota bacterium]
ARPLLRILRLLKPYGGLILLVVLFTLVFSAGRYGRAYLMKPLLDGVLVPVESASQPPATPAGSLDSLVDPISQALIPLLPDSPQDQAKPGTSKPPEQEVRRSLAQILLAAGVIVLLTPLALFGRVVLAEYALGRVHLDVQQNLARKLLALPLSAHARRRRGDLLARLQVDAESLREVLKLVLQEFGVSLIMIAIGLGTLIYISLPLTLISAVAAPLIAGVLIGFGRRIRRRAARRQVRVGEVLSRLVGILSGIKTIKSYGAEATEQKAFQREAKRVFRADMRVVQDRVLSRATVEMLNSAAGFLMLALGALLVLQGRYALTPGDVAAFATVLATTYRPIKNLAKGYSRLMEHLASAQRIFSILDAEEDPTQASGRAPVDEIREGLAFEDVGLIYADDGDRPQAALKNIGLNLKRGEVVALVGRSGAGKTSLVDLLLSLEQPSSGRLTLDGRDFVELDAASMRDRMAVVTQEAFLFDTSIAENIRYGCPSASDAEVWESARAAHVDEFCENLPDGLNTAVGELGVRLSGGQRQRIAIARALLRQPDVLIFDEATSALDPLTERIVQEAIQALRGDPLIVIVSHRLGSVRHADRIVVLEKGQIVEVGSHDELMEKAGAYRALAAS